MTRWSLSNYFRQTTFDQFQHYTKLFQFAAEDVWQTPCKLDVDVLEHSKLYTTFLDEDIQEGLDLMNGFGRLLRTDDLSDITEELWNKAGYVEVKVRPVDKATAPDYAFGNVEFKGERPRQATFYIQGGEDGGESIKAKFLAVGFGKIIGDGYTSNGVRSTAIPLSIARFSTSGLGL